MSAKADGAVDNSASGEIPEAFGGFVQKDGYMPQPTFPVSGSKQNGTPRTSPDLNTV